MNKIHYFKWDGPDETACGEVLAIRGNIAWSTKWIMVTCKKCLKAKSKVIAGHAT